MSRNKMDASDLKKTHPQKYFMRLMCNSLYYMGMGDYWYEKTKRSKTHKVLYVIWAVIMNGYLILNILNSCLAVFRTDLTAKERNNVMQTFIAHPAITAKLILLIFRKKRVRVVLERLIEGHSYKFRSIAVEKKSVNKAIWYFLALTFITAVTILTSTIDVIIVNTREGVPIQVQVTLYPSPKQSGIYVDILRFFIEFHWWCLAVKMVLTDGISFTTLIFVGFKYRLVCMYFEELREKTLNNIKTKSEEECAIEFEEGFRNGIRLHEEALWCARNVQDSLGYIYGVQVVEATTLLVVSLVKLVTLERSPAFLLAIFFYICVMLTLNGAYMLAGGNITYEASQLHTQIFLSGWELVKTRRDFHALAVVAIECSQKPVHMTAFGVITLSHENFISVIRSSYSFFAVMY